MARIEDKRSFKAINFDDADEYLDEGDTRGMLNVRVGYSESGDDGIITNVKGTVNLFTDLDFSLPSGTNKCIATCADDQNNRLIWFNYNSNSNHGIYCYNIDTSSIQTILASSVLNFSDNIIHSVDILDGNLAWVDENRPRAINVSSALAGDLGTVTIEEQINDAKVVPMLPPICTTTATRSEDYIRSLKSFQFIYRYVFIDGEKGAWSTVSKLVPTAYAGNRINKITLDVSACELFTKTPLRNVIEFVEFASRELYTSSFNQFLRISSSELVGDLGIVDYYDTESKTPIDTTETNISFYENPIKAGTVGFQNDRKFYADCTEGYDAFTLSPSLSNVNIQVIPASGGIPYLSDCDTHINDRYLKPDSEYSYSIEFKDKYARKSGAIDLPELTIKTQTQLSNDYKANVLQFGLNLASVGSYPSYADTFEILRSDNKTVTFFVQGRVNNIQYCTGYNSDGDPVYITPGGNPAGATNPNVVDTAAVEIHIDISNWTMHDINIGYTFTEGDRITFMTMGGSLDKNSTSQLKGLKIKSVLGSKLVIDYPQLGRTNLNEGTMSYTENASGADLNGVLTRFIVGDNGVALFSQCIQMIVQAFPPAIIPLAFPFSFASVAKITEVSTTNNLNAVSVIYSGVSSTSIEVYIVGDNGYFITGTFNPVTASFSAFSQITTGATANLNYIENDWVSHSMADLIIVGDGGLILKYTRSGSTLTALTSGVTSNLNCVFRDSGVVIAVGDDGVILRSTDGTTWTSIESGVCQNLNALYKNGSDVCVVGDEGVCLMSSDAGLTWVLVGLSTKYNLFTVDGEGASTSQAIYIGGENGYIGYANMATQRFAQTFDPNTSKDIKRIFSYSLAGSGPAGGQNDLGMIIGELDLLQDAYFVTPTFTDYSTNVGALYGSIILNYAAKIEVYSPKTTAGPVIYYETGDAYKVGQNYTFNKGKEGDGDVFLIKKDFKGTGWTYPGELIFSMTPDSNNTSGTWDKDLGRPNTVLLYPEKQQRRNIIRFSDKYVQNSRINGLSNFQEANYEPIPNEFGVVRKITPLESVLLINGERESATAYIDQTIFKGADGRDVAAISDTVINNIRKLAGGFGCSNPESIVQYLGSVYFYSSNKGSVCRYNNSNGIFPISEYKARTHFYELSRYKDTESLFVGGYEPKFKNYLLTITLDSSDPEANLNEEFTKGYSSETVSTPLVTNPVQSTVAQVPGGNIFMGSSGSGQIAVIDRETNELITSISVGTSIATITQHVIYANGKIYVCGATSIVCINPITNAVHATISVGINNFQLAYCDLNQSIYVSDADENNIHVINTNTNTFVTDISLPSSGDPFQIEYISDVRKVYCVDTNASPTSKLYCIDPLTNTLFATTSLPVDSRKFVYNPDNRRLYIVSTAGSSITSVNVDTNTIINTVSVGVSPFWPAYYNGYVYIPSQSNGRVYFLDTDTDTVTGSVACGSGVRFCNFNSDDNNIYCSNSSTNTISIISTETNTVTDTITVETGPQYPFFGELGKTYVPNNGSNSLSIISVVWSFQETIAFQEVSNRWISKYSFLPEKYGHAGIDLFSFKEGILWKHNANSIHNNFYGLQYNSEINPVFNVGPEKNFTYLKLEGTKVWTANPITTPEGQETFILSAHMEKIQNDWFGDIKQDINTPNMASTSEALFNGDFMQSNVLDVNLILHQASDNAQLRFATVYSNTIGKM